MPMATMFGGASANGFSAPYGCVPTVDSTTTGATTSGSPVANTFAFSVTVNSVPNRILVVAVGAEAQNSTDQISSQVASVTYGAATMIQAATVSALLDHWNTLTVFYLLNPQVGTDTLTINMSGTTTNRSGINVGASVIRNVKQIAPYINASSSVTTTGPSSISTTISPTIANTALYEIASYSMSTGTVTAASSQTTLYSISSTVGMRTSGGFSVVGTGAVSRAWTLSPALGGAPNFATHLIVGLQGVCN